MNEKYINDSWDENDEDYYPAGDDHELEYVGEDEEDEEIPHSYSSVQGNWDPEDYEDEYGYGGIQRITKKVRSVTSVYDNQQKQRKKQKNKIRSEIKEREKQRQKYYHYGEDE